jgi:hypothetical protein
MTRAGARQGKTTTSGGTFGLGTTTCCGRLVADV